MKRVKRIALALVLILGMAGCVKENKPQEKKDDVAVDVGSGYETIEVTALPGEYQIIDIREEHQYIGWDTQEGYGGHIKGAIDFPQSWLELSEDNYAIGTTLENELLRRGIDTNKPTVFYGDDTLSDDDMSAYQKLGFVDCYMLDGGFNAYLDAGQEADKLAGYSTFVSPEWVQELIEGGSPNTYEGDKFKIIEFSLSSEEDEYKNGHIKGAINLPDIFNHLPGLRVLDEYENVPMEEQLKFWNRNADEQIQKELEELGITHDTTVILYATTPATTGAYRAALLMEYAGVTDIRMINGGKTLWCQQGRELETGENSSEQAVFGKTVPENPDIIYDYEEELERVEKGTAVIASIRSWEEYTGKVSGYTYIGEAGDIANSRFGYAGSTPYSMEDFRNIDNTTFNFEKIKERWVKWGIEPDQEIVFHCGTGWRASETYFYAKAIGYENVHLYDGGWYEWSKIKDSPVMEKGVPADAPEQEPEEFFIVEDE